MAELKTLAPDQLSVYTALASDIEDAWSEARIRIDKQECVVIVGHDPQISWVLHELLGSKVGKRYPLGTGELIWLNCTQEAKAIGGIFSPSDEATASELRAKIKSKMDAAKVLGTFITALVTFAATQVLDGRVTTTAFTALAGFGLTSLVLSAVLYFITLFWYDELLMPKRFWATATPDDRSDGYAALVRGQHENVDVGSDKATRNRSDVRGFVRQLRPRLRSAERFTIARPPGSYWWVLYENMLHVWTWAFIPATGLAALGVVSLAVSLAEPAAWWWAAVATAIALVAGVGVWLGIYSRPRLGVND